MADNAGDGELGAPICDYGYVLSVTFFHRRGAEDAGDDYVLFAFACIPLLRGLPKANTNKKNLCVLCVFAVKIKYVNFDEVEQYKNQIDVTLQYLRNNVLSAGLIERETHEQSREFKKILLKKRFLIAACHAFVNQIADGLGVELEHLKL